MKNISILTLLLVIFWNCSAHDKKQAEREEYAPASPATSNANRNKAVPVYKDRPTPAKSPAKGKPASPPGYTNNQASGVSDGESTIVINQPKDMDVEHNTETYDRIYDNEFLDAKKEPLSTFSIDVDTASYSNMRRYLNYNSLPPKDSVRIEELINYFTYKYPEPEDGKPFSVSTEISNAPWKKENYLLKIGIKGKSVDKSNLPAKNLVFLLDVSGSMSDENKLPLLKRALELLVGELDKRDKVSIVVYAGASGMVLPPTSGKDKNTILGAMDKLQAGGSTNGGDGIELAYKIAGENFIKGGVNRVLLATDGDFNVGVTNQGDLIRLIEKKREAGIFLTVLGFGMGNYKDSTMEKLADKGNGNYAYIDNISEAKKVLVQQFSGTLVTIAKDVKLQLEFNPKQVKSYRLIGYENRVLKKEDFHDDKKDAGDIGLGHFVTALYEIVPADGQKANSKNGEDLRYQGDPKLTKQADSNELLNVKMRFKAPDKNKSELLTFPVELNVTPFDKTSDDFRFASSVAGFGMLLRDSEFKGSTDFKMVKKIASKALGPDEEGYRKDFIELVEKAEKLYPKK